MYPQSFNSFQFTARCLANSLGGAPLHHVDRFGCSRLSHARGDLAGLGASSLALGGPLNEEVYLAAWRDPASLTPKRNPLRALAKLVRNAAGHALELRFWALSTACQNASARLDERPARSS